MGNGVSFAGEGSKDVMERSPVTSKSAAQGGSCAITFAGNGADDCLHNNQRPVNGSMAKPGNSGLESPVA
jgi:hypothetical protein